MHISAHAIAAGLAVAFTFGPLLPSSAAAPVINEIMYRPGTGYPENTAMEYVEVFNPDAAAVDIGGWAFTSGVSYTFPAGTTIAAGGFVVVAADPTALHGAFTTVSALGPWLADASLSNNGEKITLSQPGLDPGTWTKVSSVTYASEGDWAQRIRETTFNGWDWSTPANGGGKSLELRNPAMSNDNGQNWSASTAASGGTPGAANSVFTTNVPPIIHEVKHSPAVPRTTDPVTITCTVNDEADAATRTATLFYRNATTANPPTFSSTPMTNDGSGRFSAVRPAGAADKSIWEFYISSTDGTNTRTWPAATSTGQVANCQYQVDNEVSATDVSTCRMILTAAENSAFNSVSDSSNRQFNMTMVVTTGDGTDIRYRSSMRIRGNSSRGYQFKPLRVSFPNDDTLNGATSYNINPKNPYTQYLGMRLFQASGLPAPDAIGVELRRNGVESTTSGGSTPDYGRWVLMEDFNADFINNHWPDASTGNVYKKGRPDEFWRSSQPAPASPDSQLDGWAKENNKAANDWSDIRGFFATYQSTALPYFPGASSTDVSGGTWNRTPFNADDLATLNTVADLDQWALWFAVSTILQNNETNISNGQDDDYAAYYVPSAGGQRRMQLLPNDLDTIFGLGDDGSNHGLYDSTEESSSFVPLLPLMGNSSNAGNAEFRTKYFTAIRQLFGTVFNADTTGNPNPPFYAFVDNHLTGWVPANTRTSIKTWMTSRRTSLLGLIGSGAITPPAATSTSTLTQSHGALIISEVLASNTAAWLSNGIFPDAIELRNTGATTIDLTGKSLTDDPAVKAKFTFLTGTTLAANATLVIIADSLATPGIHAGFQFNQGGDALYLYDTAASGQALLDSVVFGPQITDFSIGRTGANLDTWALCTPTIGAANTAVATLGAPGSLVINEWFGNPDFRLDGDFLEIFNPLAQPVAMGGMKLTDDFINDPAKHTLPALSFIGPNGFQVFKAKGGSASPGNASELPFSIDSTFGWLALIGANGTIVDRVDINAQGRDQSTGRSPDGGATYANQTVPSPGLPNGSLPAAYQLLLDKLRITEILYKPNGGNDYEFVELLNIGSAPLNLSGVRFTNGIDYTFPAGTTLAANAFTVVARNRTTLTSRFPAVGSVLAPGQFTGALDNNGESLTLSLPAPWDVAILNFQYDTSWEPLTFTAGYSLTTVDENTTEPRNWNERETWTVSTVADGTPGSVGPPGINSPLAASSIRDSVFSYQITATRAPSIFGATGLPSGLSVNTVSGVISGTPSQSGVFNVSINAANTAGSDTKTLVLTITTSGPLDHFTWEFTPPAAEVSVPFSAWITARDVQGRAVESFNGSVPVTGIGTGGGINNSTVVITEVTDETEDEFELQNTGNTPVNTTGWFVVLGHSSGITDVNAVTWPLPASVAPGEMLRVSEVNGAGRLYFGGGISWTVALNRGWVMLCDGGSNVKDFFAWGWTGAELAALSITVGGKTITTAGQWSGNGSPAGSRAASNANSWQRTGTSDHNTAADWIFAENATSWAVTNTGLTLPWNLGASVIVSPASATFSGGVFTGFLSVSPAATGVRLTVADTESHSGQSAPFDVTAAQIDTDGDGMPDAWESANGLNPAVNDAAGDLDKDGWSNRMEYYAGTNPRSSSSFLNISSANVQLPAQVNLSWPAVANHLYRVRYSTGLSTWTQVPGQIYAPTVSGTQTASFPPPAGAATRAFYQVELLTPP